jgi:hypothetical protein
MTWITYKMKKNRGHTQIHGQQADLISLLDTTRTALRMKKLGEHKDGQQGDLTSLILFFQNKENRHLILFAKTRDNSVRGMFLMKSMMASFSSSRV